MGIVILFVQAWQEVVYCSDFGWFDVYYQLGVHQLYVVDG